MSQTIAERLSARGITLPDAAPPAANYLPFVISGSTLHISGQLPIDGGKLAVIGHLGKELELADGQKAAELCAINILAQAQAALGSLERVARIVKINAYVASAPDFVSQHLVVNSASDLLADILGEAGRHARAAVGMASLPLDAAVEIDALIEIA